MQTRTVVSGLLLAMGLLAGGCGGVDATDAQTDLSTRKDALPSCDGLAFTRYWYSDPGLTNKVGEWRCYCGDNNAWVFGQWQSAPYYQDFNVEVCGY